MDYKRLLTSWTFWGATLTALSTSIPVIEGLTKHTTDIFTALQSLGTIWGLWVAASGARNAMFKMQDAVKASAPK